MKRLFRILVFFSFGYLLGKNHSERVHAKDAAKIVNADYLDDKSKIRLLKDLSIQGRQPQHLPATKKQEKLSKRRLLKNRLLLAAKKASRLSEPILKLKKRAK